MRIAAAVAACLLAFPAVAQELPPAADPGVVQRRFEIPRPSVPDTDGLAPAAPRLVPPPGAESVQFILREVIVEGSQVYDAEQLARAWAPHLSKQVSLATVFEIAGRLTARYRNDGFVLSQVIVPPQEVDDGRIRLRAIEGFVEEVLIEGEAHLPALWEAHAERIRTARPLDANTLERAVLLLNDLPGAGVRAVLRPSGKTVGASHLVLLAAQEPALAYLDTNNRGTRFLGRYQGEIGVTLNSWLDRYEETQLRFTHTFDNELALLSLDHSEQIGTNGTLLTLSFSYADTEPGGTLRAFDVEGEAVSGAISLRHPFIRSRTQNLVGWARFDYLDSSNDILRRSLSEDRIRALRIGASYDIVDRFEGINLLVAELSRGVDVLNATDFGDANNSRLGAKGSFAKVHVSASRLQRLGGGFNVLGTLSGQYAFDLLLSAEQFTFGGADLGRGYDAAEIIGDHGLASSIELQWGRALGFAALEGIQLFASYDFGVVWQRDERLPVRRSTASSVAVGARLNLTPWLSARVSVALPLTRPATVDRDDGAHKPRLFFGLTARY